MAITVRDGAIALKGSHSMGDGRIFLKSLCDASFNKDLSNEPTMRLSIREGHQKNYFDDNPIVEFATPITSSPMEEIITCPIATTGSAANSIAGTLGSRNLNRRKN